MQSLLRSSFLVSLLFSLKAVAIARKKNRTTIAQAVDVIETRAMLIYYLLDAMFFIAVEPTT